MSQLDDNESDVRCKRTDYSHSEIFRAWCNMFFCGDECVENIQVHLRDTLKQISGNAVPGPDTLLRKIKSLAENNMEVVSPFGKVYQFNINKKMNNFYNYIVRKVSQVFTDILSTSRLKRFLFRLDVRLIKYVRNKIMFRFFDL